MEIVKSIVVGPIRNSEHRVCVCVQDGRMTRVNHVRRGVYNIYCVDRDWHRFKLYDNNISYSDGKRVSDVYIYRERLN